MIQFLKNSFDLMTKVSKSYKIFFNNHFPTYFTIILRLLKKNSINLLSISQLTESEANLQQSFLVQKQANNKKGNR